MDFKIISDEKLVELCQSEKSAYQDAFTEIVRRYKNYVFNLASNKLGNQQDAEDAAQETFIRIYHSLKKFRYDSSLKTWITIIAGNVCLSMLFSKKRKFWKYQVSVDGNVNMENIHAMLVSREQEYDFWHRIGEILSQMLHSYRKVFIYKYFKDYSLKEIARKINTTFAAAKMRVKRAKDQFIKIFLNK